MYGGVCRFKVLNCNGGLVKIVFVSCTHLGQPDVFSHFGLLKAKSGLKRGSKLKVGKGSSGSPCGVREAANYPGFIAPNCRRPPQIKNLMCSAVAAQA